MEPGGEHWQSRFKTEQILEVSCPKCGAAPQKWCDRAGEKLSRAGAALRRAGTPPSHQERMWLRQGHDPREFPALLARQRPGLWDEPAPPAAAVVPGPRPGCTPCARERVLRSELACAAFPLEFPCRHPQGGFPVPSLPVRYHADRPCPECSMVVPVEVVVQSPAVVGYRCGAGHRWLGRPVAAKS